MQKIKLKIKPDHLKTIVEDYYREEETVATTKVAKVVISLSSDLMIKLEKKLITKRGEKKEFGFSLKYHEAFALLEIAQKQSVYAPSDYERNLYRMLVQQLDKQL